MPQEVDAVIALFSNRARAQILHELATTGPATAPELAGRMGSGRAVISAHLAALQSAGVVHGDLPAGQRHGRTVHWSIDVERVEEHLRLYAHYLTNR